MNLCSYDVFSFAVLGLYHLGQKIAWQEVVIAELEVWGDAVLDAKTLEEFFAAIPAEQ